jgi:DNA-binding transcriptional LysR family regulator
MANWVGVNEFVAVVECKSYTLAAKRLGVSTAQVSRQVAQLEKRLGSKLLNRTTRVVSPTETGETFYRHCKPILEELESAERLITNLQAKPQGKLFMTAPVTFGERKIAPIVTDLALAYPDLNIRLNLTNHKVDLVNEGYDLAIRLGKLESSSLIARRLASRALFTVASPVYLAAHGAPNSLSELHRHACIMGSTEHWSFSVLGQERSIKIEPRFRCNSGNTLISAALKHMGLVQLPDYYVQPYLASGALVAVLPQLQVADDGIWALYPHTRHMSPKVRLVIDRLMDGLNTE